MSVCSGDRKEIVILNPRELLRHIFEQKNPVDGTHNKYKENTPDTMILETFNDVSKAIIFVEYTDFTGNFYRFSLIEIDGGNYKLVSTYCITTREEKVVANNEFNNTDKIPAYVLEKFGDTGLNKEDAVKEVARFCAIFEVDRLLICRETQVSSTTSSF